jgi:hypothetical protein
LEKKNFLALLYSFLISYSTNIDVGLSGSDMRKKQSNIFLLLFLSLFPLFLMGGGLFFCCRSTGFSVDKISSNFTFDPRWEIDSISDKQREQLAQKAFPQTYYYLAAGNHCYAFISEDRQYVLKFFKMQSLFPKGWMGSFPLSLLRHFGFRQESNNKLFSERLFASYKDAYESLRKETGLIYLHLNKTRDFGSYVTLIDSKGKKHVVELDTMVYIVQKRATRIFDHLKELVDQDRHADLKASIRSFLRLIAVRCEKGFVNHDMNIRNNFGYIGNTAIQFDCASLTRDSSMKYPMNFRQEVLEAAERLDIWARENCSDINIFIQEEAQELINQF